jgi:endonuclease III
MTIDIELFIAEVAAEVKGYRVPVVDLIAVQSEDPFKVLVATILSARTRDETTARACERLFARAPDLEALALLSAEEIRQLIFPVGFYQTKADHLARLPAALATFGKEVPAEIDDLVTLPGVGRKTANLVRTVAFRLPAICVDTHVHRIMNIWGYVHTKTPLETEMALRATLPARHWLTINSILVAFGQGCCTPVGPHCDCCPLDRLCPKIGVTPRKRAREERSNAKKAGRVNLLTKVENGRARTIAPPYEVARWPGFKTAAVSYTFDDGTPHQLPVAIPIFNAYGYQVTLFTVTGWVANWGELTTAAAQGHEIGSHTVDHVCLEGLPPADERYQYELSRDTIAVHCPQQQLFTIAYPYCRKGKESLCALYYSAGRNCAGAIVPPTPTNFYEINSYSCGSKGSVKTTADFISLFESAQSAGGWLVLLVHGIDHDGGYSPLSSRILQESVQYLAGNRETFWVATFGNVVRYIKERDDLSVAETSVQATRINVRVTGTLDNTIYTYPVTLRRPLPAGWSKATVTQNGCAIPSSLVTINSVGYVMFDAVPGGGEVVISSPDNRIGKKLLT